MSISFSLFSAFASPLFLLCCAISIWWYLAFFFFFFCCNQTHRFISVILRHDLNQFPSTLTSWRVAVRDGTLQLRHTYIDTPTQTLSISFTFTHTVVKVQRRVPIYPHTRHTHTHTGDSPHHCSLMSYLLHLCNFHLSLLTGPGSNIYPSYLYPYSVSPHCFSPPWPQFLS